MALIKELLGDYQAALQSRGQRPRGIERYIGQLRNFAGWIGTTTVERITPKHVSRYQANLAQRCAPSSLQVSISALRSFFQWTIDEALRDDDPTVRLPWPKRQQTFPRGLSRQQVRHVRYTLDHPPDTLTTKQQWIWQRNRLVVLTLLRTGIRISEAVALQWKDIDLEQPTLRVRNGKGGKERTIPLRPSLVAELRQWQSTNPEHAVLPAYPDGRPFASAKSMGHIFDRWLPQRGITITAHQLRHTFATELLRRGADLESVRILLGHTSLATTQCYLHVDADHLRDAMDCLPDDW
jgi:site-specific recombinase XerD